MPKVSNLYSFPVKSMLGLSQSELSINPIAGVIGDRQIALTHKPDQPIAWAKRRTFACGVVHPKLLSISPHEAQTNLDGVARILGVETLTPLDSKGAFNFTDTEGPTVSLLNMATHRLFEEFIGKPVDPRRWRMNVHVEGLAPFVEYDLASTYPGQHPLTIGTGIFTVLNACERCMATHTNPNTGINDLDVVPQLARFMHHYKPTYLSPQNKVNIVMGVLLQPTTQSIIKLEDNLSI